MTEQNINRALFFGSSFLSLIAVNLKLFTDNEVLFGLFVLPYLTKLDNYQSRLTAAITCFYFPLLCVTLGRMAAQSVYGGPVPSP